MKNFDNKTEELIQELTRKNRKLLVGSWALGWISVLFYLGIVLLAAFTLEENGIALLVVVLAAVVLLLIAVFYALKMEVEAGYYECRNCKHKFVPTYKEVILAAHMSTKRRLRCPECGKKTWTKKVMNKE